MVTFGHFLNYENMKKLILCLFLMFSLATYAQSSEKNFIDQNYIEVTGKSETEIVPDMIYLKIVLSEKDIKNKQGLESMENAMKKRLREIGVDISKDLSIMDFVSNFKANWLNRSDIVLTKDFQLIVHDTKVLQNVFLELEKLSISNVSIERVDHSKLEQFKRSVKTDAIKAAKVKAESLTAAIGQTVGRAIYIQEFEDMYKFDNLRNSKVERMNLSMASAGNTDQAAPELEFEKIKLSGSVLVRFELK